MFYIIHLRTECLISKMIFLRLKIQVSFENETKIVNTNLYYFLFLDSCVPSFHMARIVMANSKGFGTNFTFKRFVLIMNK